MRKKSFFGKAIGSFILHSLRMRFTHILSSQHSTQNWTGGTTTQLFIYPSDSLYSERNFDFRISTATVETKRSEFTVLPEIDRKLMVLSGKIALRLGEKPILSLSPFDQVSFFGDEQAVSVGTCTDFNVMTRGEYRSELTSLHGTASSSVVVTMEPTTLWGVLYCFQGRILLESKGEKWVLEEGDVWVAENETHANYNLTFLKKTDLIIAKISR